MILARSISRGLICFPTPRQVWSDGRPLPSSADAGVQAAAAHANRIREGEAAAQDFLHSVGVSEISYQGACAPHPLLDAEVRKSRFGSGRHWTALIDSGGSAAANPSIRTLAPRAGASHGLRRSRRRRVGRATCGFTTNPPWDCLVPRVGKRSGRLLSRIPLVTSSSTDDGGESLLRKVSGS